MTHRSEMIAAVPDDLVRAEIVRMIAGGWPRYVDGLLFAFPFAAVFCGMIFDIGRAPLLDAALWLAQLCGWSILGLALCWLYLRDPDRYDPKTWEIIWAAIWILHGVTCGLVAWWFFEPGNLANHALIGMIVLGFMVGNFYQLGASFPVLASSTIAIGVTVWPAFLFDSGEMSTVICVAFPPFVAMLVARGLGVSRRFDEAIRLRFANERLAADLDKARVAAENANNAKNEFLANMSHELRTPLNAILGFSDMMHKEILGPHAVPHYREYAGHILNSGAHLFSIVDDILDIAKIEAGRMELRPRNVNAREVAHSVAATLQTRVAAAGLTLQIGAADAVFQADEKAVRQVLLNLLSNAIKFTSSGGRIEVAATVSGAIAEFTVRDTGCGIAPDMLPKVFEPFVQADNTFSRSTGGTGLGLPIVRALARMHGGDARIDSELGVGTRVTVSFPQHSTPSAVAA